MEEGGPDGTPRALAPIAEAVLGWVGAQRATIRLQEQEVTSLTGDPDYAARSMVGLKDIARKVELCALVARDVAAFHTLYPPPGGENAPAPQVRDEC